MLSEERSTLAVVDARVTKQRKTRTAQEATLDPNVVAVPGEVAEQASNLLRERQVSQRWENIARLVEFRSSLGADFERCQEG